MRRMPPFPSTGSARFRTERAIAASCATDTAAPPRTTRRCGIMAPSRKTALAEQHREPPRPASGSSPHSRTRARRLPRTLIRKNHPREYPIGVGETIRSWCGPPSRLDAHPAQRMPGRTDRARRGSVHRQPDRLCTHDTSLRNATEDRLAGGSGAPPSIVRDEVPLPDQDSEARFRHSGAATRPATTDLPSPPMSSAPSASRSAEGRRVTCLRALSSTPAINPCIARDVGPSSS